MLHQTAWLATVTILGVLEQAYFALQVISVRRKCKITPPLTLGPPEFERIFRAQTNCSEYFPIFISLLWVSGIFSHQVLAAFCGLLYLYARYWYFTGYARSAQERNERMTKKLEELNKSLPGPGNPHMAPGLQFYRLLSTWKAILKFSFGFVIRIVKEAHKNPNRLGPMYFSTGVLCILIVLSVVGLTTHFVSLLYF